MSFTNKMNDFNIPEARRYVSSVFFVIYAGADFIKESMLIFDRSKEQKYDVLVAEVITQRGLNPER